LPQLSLLDPNTGAKYGYCTYVFRGRLLPTPEPQNVLQEFEDEIMHPTGRRIVHIQPAGLEGVFVSHDCGILIKMDKGTNLRYRLELKVILETDWNILSDLIPSGRSLSPVCSVEALDSSLLTTLLDSAVAFCLYFIIAYALANQIEWTRTPASISRVSRWPFAIQAVGDSYAFIMVCLGVMFLEHLLTVSPAYDSRRDVK